MRGDDKGKKNGAGLGKMKYQKEGKGSRNFSFPCQLPHQSSLLSLSFFPPPPPTYFLPVVVPTKHFPNTKVLKLMKFGNEN